VRGCDTQSEQVLKIANSSVMRFPYYFLLLDFDFPGSDFPILVCQKSAFKFLLFRFSSFKFRFIEIQFSSFCFLDSNFALPISFRLFDFQFGSNHAQRSRATSSLGLRKPNLRINTNLSDTRPTLN